MNTSRWPWRPGMTAAADARPWRLVLLNSPVSNGSFLVKAVRLEVEALRVMLGLPLEEPEPDARAPPETMRPDKPIPLDQDTPNTP